MKSRKLILALAACALSLALPSRAEGQPKTEIQVAQSAFTPPPTGDDNERATKGDLRWYWEQNELRWELNERRWREFRAENDRRWDQNDQRLLQLAEEIHDLYLAILGGLVAIIVVLLGRPLLARRERAGASGEISMAAMAALLAVGAAGATAVVLAG